MRTIALLVVLVSSPFFAGCGGNSTLNAEAEIEGVKLKVQYPVSFSSHGESEGFTDTDNHRGTRWTHTWSNDAGVKQGGQIVEIVDSRLQINGKSYGTVAKGDSVFIDGDKIQVNGTSRKDADDKPESK